MPESSVPLLPPFAVSSTAPSLLFSPSYCGGMRGGGKVPAKTIDAARPFWKPKTPNFEGKLLCVCPIISGCFFLGGRRPVLRYEAISHFYCPPLHASLRKNLFHRRLSAAAQACIGEEEEEEVRFYCCLLSPSLPLPQVERQERRNRKKTPGGNRRGREKKRRNVTVQPVKLSACQARCSASTNRKGGGGKKACQSGMCVEEEEEDPGRSLLSPGVAAEQRGRAPSSSSYPPSPFCVPSGKNLAPANLESGEGESRTRKGKKGGRKGKLPPSTHTQEGGAKEMKVKEQRRLFPFASRGASLPFTTTLSLWGGAD